ncbi:C-terminal binding protein [Evansella tamaricis]|uniref:C-terminal binding protein n=1 Tax=Evansella tamaricis TaxID=2069301 RepID=A0ABS6JDI2_9BACI|nr:C-terminal binding protein [Evansella tamaricis]MBU9711641.1 C-terminal binding protein [Evansella tamaricis]
MSIPKVIITDCDHENIDIESSILKKPFVDLELTQFINEKDIIENCKGATSLIIQYAELTDKVFSHLPDLKQVVRYGVGVNTIDIEAATKYGVQISNVPDYGTQEVSDHALAHMLNLTRKIGQMNDNVRNGIWDFTKSMPVFRHSEQTVGVIGVGRIGSAFCEKVHALGCEVLAYDPKVTDRTTRKVPDFLKMVSLEDLLKRSDVVSIHCPLETAHDLIGEKELRLMKDTAYLINVSRGGIVNELALDHALTEGWIAGAAVDVAENEPLTKEHPLFKHKNFVCTPHMAWYSEESAKELKRKVSEEVLRFLNNEQVHYPINKLY